MRLLTLIVALLAAPSALAQTGSLSGAVTDSTGAALPGATVYLPQIQRGAATDLGGRYAVLRIAPDTYEVHVVAAKHESRVETVRIGDGRATRLDVWLAAGTRTIGWSMDREPIRPVVRALWPRGRGLGEMEDLPVRGPHPFPDAPPWPPEPRR